MAPLLLFLVFLLGTFPAKIPAATYNVLDFGASHAGGGADRSTEAFQRAWNAACMAGEPTSTMHVPEGKYLIKPITFAGPCKSPSIELRIDGTLVASPGNLKHHKWIHFNEVDNISIVGGTLDGDGTALWSCKRSRSRSCPSGPISLSIGHSNRVTVTNLISKNPKLFHMFIYGSSFVSVDGGKLIAAKSSPNTDGIHIQMSANINISGTSIGTGDDCISMGPGTTGIYVQNVTCGPGHGISIGSLGGREEERGVDRVRVRNVTFEGTDNGLRIKTWGKRSNGYVNDVVFEHAIMKDVKNPILIDQNYCPIRGCPAEPSGIKISKVAYRHVVGTSATKVAMNLNCSPREPCRGIRLHHIDLTYNHNQALSSCKHATGTASLMITPPSCLS